MTEIEGYSKLSEYAKLIFVKAYQNHQASLCGLEKAKWQPLRVSENKDSLIVSFKNGKWLHYILSGTWY